MKSKGFTLIELLLVLAVMGILVTLAVPGYQSIVFRSRAAEPRVMLPVIANAELAYFRDHGKYLAADFSTPDGKVSSVPRAFDVTRPGWKELGLRADGFVRYRYQVVLAGDSFTVIANGDLDANGTTSTFELAGRTLSITARDELE
jgi:prepilin-type N-terminal cleavage/methylation domain-containing protein